MIEMVEHQKQDRRFSFELHTRWGMVGVSVTSSHAITGAHRMSLTPVKCGGGVLDVHPSHG